MSSVLRDYRIIAAEKRQQRSNKIPTAWLIAPDTLNDDANVMDVPVTCGILTDIECEITSNYDATALLDELKQEVWSVEQVTLAFCKRAAIAQQLTNCLTQIFFDEAITRARLLDQERKDNPSKSLPPLWGLPISLKDSFQVVGHDTTTGLGCYANTPAENHSAVAAILLDLGAILYCKTNLPQSIMTGDSDNNIFGRTLNPRNSALTAGGSTGGEGALIALRGSILGVGTDIGGSIRVPASCNGIFGFRPSVGLIPHAGVRDVAAPGSAVVRSTVGPMATSIRDCALFLKAFLKMEMWRYDAAVVSLPWRGIEGKERLRIGVVEDDVVYTPTPPVRRVLRESVDRLRKSSDFDVVPIALPNVKEHIADLIGYFTLLGGDYYREQFARTGEPVIKSLQACGLLEAPGTTLQGFFDLNVRRAAAAETYLALFRDNNIDAILMPPAPHTTVPLDKWSTLTYTGLWNYLDYPAVVMPVDKVRDTDVVDDLRNAKYGTEDAKLYNLYTGPGDYKDAPVCLQVVGYRYSDEALMNTVTALDKFINGRE